MIDPHGMTGDTLEIRRQPFPHIHQYAVWYFTAWEGANKFLI